MFIRYALNPSKGMGIFAPVFKAIIQYERNQRSIGFLANPILGPIEGLWEK
jgi:hypothetical protein